MTSTNSLVECLACYSQATGYSNAELTDDGWRWRGEGKGHPLFAFCPDCARKYAPIWQARAVAA